MRPCSQRWPASRRMGGTSPAGDLAGVDVCEFLCLQWQRPVRGRLVPFAGSVRVGDRVSRAVWRCSYKRCCVLAEGCEIAMFPPGRTSNAHSVCVCVTRCIQPIRDTAVRPQGACCT
eukprot:6762173-Prymnesium_polylepis.1